MIEKGEHKAMLRGQRRQQPRSGNATLYHHHHISGKTLLRWIKGIQKPAARATNQHKAVEGKAGEPHVFQILIGIWGGFDVMLLL